MFQCQCCSVHDGSISPTMPDVCIVYKLHLECGQLINLYDWMQVSCFLINLFSVSISTGSTNPFAACQQRVFGCSLCKACSLMNCWACYVNNINKGDFCCPLLPHKCPEHLKITLTAHMHTHMLTHMHTHTHTHTCSHTCSHTHTHTHTHTHLPPPTLYGHWE